MLHKRKSAIDVSRLSRAGVYALGIALILLTTIPAEGQRGATRTPAPGRQGAIGTGIRGIGSGGMQGRDQGRGPSFGGRDRATRGGGRGGSQQDQGRERRGRTRDRRSRAPEATNPFLRNAVNTTQGSGPVRARPGERSEIAKRRRSGTTSIAGTVGDFPKYELDPVIVTDTVYFAPAEVTTQVGERFSTPIVFYNAGEHEIDRIDLWIHYNPELFDPVWINEAEIEPRLAAPLTREVWRARGYIHIEGRLNEPLTQQIQPLVTINWRTGATGTTAEIEIESPAGEVNGIYDGEVNCLRLSRIGNAGVVSVRVRVVDPNLDDDKVILEIFEGGDPYAPAHRESRGVHLALIAADERVYPSEVSTVDIVILNPDLVPFDELRIRVRYDPEALEILDADADNYITDGINIFDGAFHQRMPFEHHGKNLVDPERGIIEYVMASGEGLRPYPSGTVARIVFRMKRDAGSTTLWFEGLDPYSNRYLSDVRAQGRSMLGPADGREAEGLHHTRVRVSPL